MPTESIKRLLTNQLTGRELDWYTLLACGWVPDRVADGQMRLPIAVVSASPFAHLNWCSTNGDDRLCVVGPGPEPWRMSPSTNWAHGGPLIAAFNIALEFHSGANESRRYRAIMADMRPAMPYRFVGPVDSSGGTHLEAACRAIIVAFKGRAVKAAESLGGGEPC